jgi:YD repeat-containing protein
MMFRSFPEIPSEQWLLMMNRPGCVIDLARIVGVIAACLLLLLPAVSAHAAPLTDRFDYDALGRLVRVIDSAGRVTEYVYDAVGNILAVKTGGSVGDLVPTVSAVSIASFRKGAAAQVVVTGTNFAASRLNSADASITIDVVTTTATQYSFSVSAADAAVPGVKSFTIANSAGSANFSLTLAPQLPVAAFNPQPIALPPDKAPRTFTVVLSNADTVAHVVNFSVDNVALATVSPASVTFAPGEVSKTIQISGLAGGTTTVRATSASLAAAAAPVFVTADFAGVRTAYGALVGVLMPTPPVQNILNINGMISPAVGVTVGAFFRAVQPRALVRGQTTSVVITGANLQGVTGIAINPPAGITVTGVTPAMDGLSVVASVAVTADAAIAARQVVLTGAGGPFRATVPGADRLWVLDGLPVVTSVEPFQAAPNMFGIALRVRGRNLHTAESILIPAASNVRISRAFTVNAEGTEIVGGMEVPLNAVPGSYPVQVVTSAGTSDGVPTPMNTFTVVNEIQSIFTPINAPLVGVVNGGAVLPQPLTGPLFSNLVGVAVGGVVSNVAPRAAIVGQTTSVTLSGNALQGVTGVQITPADGLTMGPVAVAPDGRSATLDVTAAADAPRTLRRLRVLAGTQTVPLSAPELGAFLVTLPVPVLESVAPLNLRAGDPPLSFTVRGKNLHGLTAIRFQPDTGIAVGSNITVDGAGASATVSVTVAAGASTGPRVVVVETPAGASSAVASIANTVTVAGTISAVYDGIVAPLVGVQNGTLPPPAPVTYAPILAAPVGVLIPTTPTPVSTVSGLFAPPAGVVVGPAALLLEQTPLLAGGSGTLSVTGVGLNAVTQLQVSPATGITLGAPTITGNGSQLTVPVTVAAGAATSPRQLRLAAGATPVSFTQGATSVFHVAAAAPQIDSIEPILGRQGESFLLLIRGAHLQAATMVLAEPAQGVELTTAPVVNAAGTEATVGLRIAPTAALGSRVIRVVTPGGGVTTNLPVPANTFTVYAP